MIAQLKKYLVLFCATALIALFYSCGHIKNIDVEQLGFTKDGKLVKITISAKLNSKPQKREINIYKDAIMASIFLSLYAVTYDELLNPKKFLKLSNDMIGYHLKEKGVKNKISKLIFSCAKSTFSLPALQMPD